MTEPDFSSLSPQMRNADRISALPDHLLCKILSFLTVKEAATSSILSTRWRHVFTSIPNIILEFTLPEEIDQDRSHMSKFISFGNRLFRLRNGALIRKFKISYDHYDNCPHLCKKFRLAIESWLCAAVSCNVQELSISCRSLIKEHSIQSIVFQCKTLVSLDLHNIKPLQFKGISLPLLKVLRLEGLLENDDLLPEFIQGCPILEELDLNVHSWGDIAADQLSRSGIFSRERLVALNVRLGMHSPVVFPDSICLPNLKALYIEAFHLSPDDNKGDDAIQCLLNSCPVLEEFHLYGLCFPNNQSGTVRIQSSSLKFFSLQTMCFFMDGRYQYIVVIESTSLECLVYDGLYGDKYRLIVNTPNLRHFDYTGYLERVQFPLGLGFPLTAIVSVEYSFKEKPEHDSLLFRLAFELVTDLQVAKSLWLSDYTLEALYHCPNPLPSFNNLTCLKLYIRDRMDVTRIKPEHWWKMFQRLSARAPNLEVLVMENVFWDTWIPNEEFDSFERFLHVNLPVHLIERLKEIRMDAFEPHDNDFLAFEYILDNGKALKRLTIGALPWQSNSLPEYCSRILSLKKCSEDCQIIFKCEGFPSEFLVDRLESVGMKTFFSCG